ncbi:hypothetical protein RvY_04234 [Ramazzottius varieornatus]|uniref:Uncharacterized protein n=1 Tax=Ramazzottius varieornatus TaxID=947166 RepID=A0A1D1UQW9_RAMVA|nr:hypothetical protein RvY_04234 [Ramazzottius varieornatus]
MPLTQMLWLKVTRRPLISCLEDSYRFYPQLRLILSFCSFVAYEMISIVLGVAALLVAVYYWWANNASEGIHSDNFPPGPKGLPIVGDIFLFASKSRHTTIQQFGKQFGGVFSTRAGTAPRAVWVTSYKGFREALIDRAWGFAGRPEGVFFKDQSSVHHPGMIISGTEESAKNVRKFTLVTLRNLGFGQRSMQANILQEAENVITEFRRKKSEPFNPRSIVALATANVIASITLGRTFKYGDEGMVMMTETITFGMKQILVAARDRMFPFMKYLPNNARTIMAEVFGSIKGFLNKIIDEHRPTHVPNEPRDFIDVWLDQSTDVVTPTNSIYSSERLPNVLVDLFAGGFETTATAFQWLFVMMLHHPEIQSKIHKELDRVVGLNAEVTLDHRDELVYTEAVILETLRVYPLLPFAIPHQATDDTMLGGYLIPKGTTVMMHLYSILHDPELWDNVEEFKPDRFIKDGKISVPEYFVPFGAGRRSCIGEQLARKELFLVFANIMSHFNLEKPAGAEVPSLETIQAVVLQPKPFEIVAKPRQ